MEKIYSLSMFDFRKGALLDGGASMDLNGASILELSYQVNKIKRVI